MSDPRVWCYKAATLFLMYKSGRKNNFEKLKNLSSSISLERFWLAKADCQSFVVASRSSSSVWIITPINRKYIFNGKGIETEKKRRGEGAGDDLRGSSRFSSAESSYTCQTSKFGEFQGHQYLIQNNSHTLPKKMFSQVHKKTFVIKKKRKKNPENLSILISFNCYWFPKTDCPSSSALDLHHSSDSSVLSLPRDTLD